MFFPIGDTQVQQGNKPLLSYIIIALNVLVYLYEFSLGEPRLSEFVTQYGTIPAEITNGQDYYTVFTSMFLHGGWMHLIGNMLFLWVFADNIEATIGYTKFLLFYLLGGIAASLTHILLSPNSMVPCVGASGAIAACLGAYIVMFPKSKIKILFLIFFTVFYVNALYFLGFWIVQQLVSGFGSLGIATADTAGVAYWAHIGGFAFGVLAGFYFKNRVKMKMEAV
jgi:membrane associated rhomboid family serine protease